MLVYRIYLNRDNYPESGSTQTEIWTGTDRSVGDKLCAFVKANNPFPTIQSFSWSQQTVR